MVRKILVVDDNHDAADSFVMLLQMEGFDVHVAYTGERALEVVAVHQPDVALVDLGMPGMDGCELARLIRKREGERILIIAVTAWGREQDRRRAVEAGFDHHLLKPVDIEDVRKLLIERDTEA